MNDNDEDFFERARKFDRTLIDERWRTIWDLATSNVDPPIGNRVVIQLILELTAADLIIKDIKERLERDKV
jgi:hypothetical protein